MIRECIVLEGKVLNIGPWNYQVQRVVVEDAKYDDQGNEITPAIYEDRMTNPLPDGAETVDKEVSQGTDGGWYVTDQPRVPTSEERMQAIEDAMNFLLGTVKL